MSDQPTVPGNWDDALSSQFGVQDDKTVSINYAELRLFLDDQPHWSEAQKMELLDALLQLLIGFVDLGFDVLPAPQNDMVIGQNPFNQLADDIKLEGNSINDNGDAIAAAPLRKEAQ
ncbi:MAG: hypothetical protein AAF225_07900 [Pseudomonadota bacterium]